MSTTATPPQRHHTFWCHECDMSVYLLHPPPPNPPRCPHCHSDFLEQMDSFTPILPPPFPTNPNPTDPTTTTTFTPSDDNFLLDSPYLHRLIHHLTTTNAAAPAPANAHHTPASKSAIDALDVVKISSSVLKNDPIIPCPICKDQFVLDIEVKVLPCKHMYHPDCIFPWLEMNNTCPVCRFRLPTEEEEVEDHGWNREDVIGAMRLEELLGQDEDLFGLRRTLRRVARRHQLNEESTAGVGVGGVSGSLEFLLSPTQIGEAGGGVARANSVETVSSWPSWPVESGSEGEVGGSGSDNRLGG